MKKILLGALLAVSGFANAETSLPLVKVNCDDVKLSLNTVMDNKLNFGAYWNDAGVFPNPPKYTEIGDSVRSKIKKFKIQCPNFSASYDGNIAEIKSDNYEAVLAKFSKFDLDPKLYSISGYKYPNIKEGFMNSSYSIDLNSFSLKTSIYDLVEGEDFNDNLRKTISVKKDSIIGYKVDGGELKPLLYDRRVSSYKNDFSSAKTIDIYHKISSSDVGVVIQRIFIDKENGVLRIYRKSPFPTK
ncbi:hypothetical protein [Acinetobacter bereziniae]|uniref:hypothetical protein n=1 Tax=Acinetobacter bereziniae TaxID=106648 RepID=UPI0032B60FA0